MALIPSRYYHVRLDTDTGRYIVATGDPANDYDIVGPLTKNAIIADADGNEVSISQDSELFVTNASRGASEVKTTTLITTATSVNRATVVTPSSGKRIRVGAVMITMPAAATTPDVVSVYFGLGVAYITVPSLAIAEASIGGESDSFSIAFPEGGGPIGGVGQVVSWITLAETEATLRLTLVYREE